MEAGQRQQHGLATATGIGAPRDRAAPIPGAACTPGGSWQARVLHEPHCPGGNLDTGSSFSDHTCFPFKTQPGIPSSRKLTLTIPSPSSNSLHYNDQVVPSSVVCMSVSQASLGSFSGDRGHPSSESTAQCLA